jgi:hypothetical protein
MPMISGGKGLSELAIRDREANHHYRYAPLIFGHQDARAAVNGEKQFLLAEAPFFAPYLVNYVLTWRYSGAWRFNPSDAFGRPRTLQVASAYPTPYSLRSIRRSWILSDSERLEMGTAKLLEPTNFEALQFAPREVKVQVCLGIGMISRNAK